ncbi:hypothetical protein [Streptomyces glomeratus]|uniref:Uncharacterized protein n=1 Tax=Streptomyces glomeratus TaxID=284452 RepID=A0ABP6M315_9ACTN|nr:hypothetical protein [Streptomyces glomeratus]MCF1512724.1 hypothetical protein [Streptomyces glomeratus]
MSSPDEQDMSHPLEQETGEKDVLPEEEGTQQPAATSDQTGEGDGDTADSGDEPASEES